MANINPIIPFKSPDINAKLTGPILLGRTNDNQKLIPLQVFALALVVTGISGAPSVSIGTNSPNYDNILPIYALTGANAADRVFKKDITGAVGTIAPNTEIYVNITTGAIGTTCTMNVSLLGLYW